ncbi:hypothetical protein PLESTB_000907000 [Pleodorina starrii]|uniref:Uncharacterized protein n=1 Tax=Pleodorina starrii TaxID=330485 RepID=A0A9W6BMA0_9CHLO|nr:hypothetical protein PLESTB_000907000 [Pleodorina starrii]
MCSAAECRLHPADVAPAGRLRRVGGDARGRAATAAPSAEDVGSSSCRQPDSVKSSGSCCPLAALSGPAVAAARTQWTLRLLQLRRRHCSTAQHIADGRSLGYFGRAGGLGPWRQSAAGPTRGSLGPP